MTWSNSNPIGAGLLPSVAASGNSAIAVYSSGTPAEVWAAHSSDGGQTFAAPLAIVLSNGSDAGGSGPVCAFNPDGAAAYVVAPLYGADNVRSLYLIKYNGGWQTWRRITNTNSNAAAITITPDGAIHIVYHEVFTSGTDSQAVHIVSTDGGTTFSPPQPISGRGSYGDSAALTQLAGGGLAAWYCWGYTAYCAIYNGGAWGAAAAISTARSYWIKPAGKGATWQQSDGSIMFARAGSAPVAVNNAVGNIFPSGAEGPDGKAKIVWIHGSSSNAPSEQAITPDSYAALRLYEADEQADGSFGSAYQVEADAGRASYPGVACGSNFVLAYQFDPAGGVWGVRARWQAAGGPPPPPPPSQQRFADVGEHSAFYGAANWAYDNGIVHGYACGGPNEPCGPDNLPYLRPNETISAGRLVQILFNQAHR